MAHLLEKEIQDWVSNPIFVRHRTKQKAHTFNSSSEPSFPKNTKEYDLLKKIVLQVTDLKSNHNKYYCLELHAINSSCLSKYKFNWRLFSHYGRSDDLESNPKAGQRETRYYSTLIEAQAGFGLIMQDKTSPKKGYQPVQLFSSKIGSEKSVEQESALTPSSVNIKQVSFDSSLPRPIQELIKLLYEEAKAALTSSISAQITSKGIETPLGVLGPAQIEKGEDILNKLYSAIVSKKDTQFLLDLSSQFYTIIPHKIGRSKIAMNESIIATLPVLEKKRELLQLMRDMLKVNEGGVLYSNQVDMQYKALRCTLTALSPSSPDFSSVSTHFLQSQVVDVGIQIKNIFLVARSGEKDKFHTSMGNEKLLFHGSKIQNWVGILSRGILLPKVIESMGVKRTNFGWLGAGIYFGGATDTSAIYCTKATNGSQFMLVCRVALGRVKTYTKITQHLEAPPTGFDSCQGLAKSPENPDSDFTEDEFVIYDDKQHFQEYLVEFTTSTSDDTLKQILDEKAKGSSSLPSTYNTENKSSTLELNKENMFGQNQIEQAKQLFPQLQAQVGAIRPSIFSPSTNNASGPVEIPDRPLPSTNMGILLSILCLIKENFSRQDLLSLKKLCMKNSEAQAFMISAVQAYVVDRQYEELVESFRVILSDYTNPQQWEKMEKSFNSEQKNTIKSFYQQFFKEIVASNYVLENQSLGNQSFGNQSFGNQSFGNQLVGNQSFGNQSFGQQNSPFQTNHKFSVPNHQEMLVLVGRPASGKSTFVKKYLQDYHLVNRDTLKTMVNCLKYATLGLQTKKSVVIDNTNPDPAARLPFLELAKEYNVPVRAVNFQTPTALANRMMDYRQRTQGIRIPPVAVTVFNKQYQPPSQHEGFSEVIEWSVDPKELPF